MNRNTQIILVILALVVLAGLVWWGTNRKEIAREPKVIRIGFLGPFSGGAATFGEMMQRGLDLAMEELPPDVKANIQIIKEDDTCKAAVGVTAAKKLVEVDQVNYVIGPLCNEVSVATEQLFEEGKVIALTIGLPSNKIANMGPYHFAFSPEIEYLMDALTTKIMEKNLKKVAVIRMQATFEEENYNHFTHYLKQKGGEIVADEAAQKGTTDFRTAILKIRQEKPDAIMLVAHTAELNSILKQLKEQGLGDIAKFGIHAAETPVLLKEASDLAEGFVYPYPAEKIESEAANAYAKKYKERFNFDPDPYSANVYDSFNILVKTVRKCGYPNKECVLREFANIKDYPGANGLLTVDERGIGTYKTIMLKTVKDSQFQKLAD